MLTTTAMILALATAQTKTNDVRLRGGLGVVAAAGYSFNPSTGGFSPGLDLELGLTFNDQVGLVLRSTGGTIYVSSALTTGGAVEFALSERLYLSAGLGIGWLGPIGDSNLPLAANLVAPARLSWMFAPVKHRQGFTGFVELAPGIRLTDVGPGPNPPGPNPPGPKAPLMGLATIGVGYAWK